MNSDHFLIQAAQKGDTMAFRTLVIEHSPQMYRAAWRVVRDDHIAEDIVQESLLKAHERLDTFAGASSIATWLHRIAVNTALDHLRKRKTRSEVALDEVPETGETPDADTSQDLSEQTAQAMRDLTELERSAFTLRHFEGYSLKEIGEQLDMNVNAVKQAVFRAVQKVRVHLKPLVTP